MASCSLSPAAGLELQRGNRFLLASGGKELSRSLRIEPRRNLCVARASLTISSSAAAPAAAAATAAPIESTTTLIPLNRLFHLSSVSFSEREQDRNPITAENLDVWLRDSIGEIVRHIGEAPFLVRIFSSSSSSGGGGGGAARIEREAPATAERWSRIKERWDREGRTPDGVILVEELRDEEGGGGEKAWGLVVQGKGMDCAACYILNTCRVRSSVGFCTHFCLVRAKCFGEAAEVQFQKAWLQGRS